MFDYITNKVISKSYNNKCLAVRGYGALKFLRRKVTIYWMDTLCIYNNIQIFTLFCLRCGVLADAVEIRNQFEICVEKVVGAIEKLLEDEGEQHSKIQS
jgi:hypothetical protein